MKVVLCWHMHQPEYRDLASGEFQLPWTYLHAIKDYVDMAAHLEAHPQACAVVNFAPVLLDQIDAYCHAITHYFDNGTALPDPVLATLVQDEFSADGEQRLALLKKLIRVNRKRVVDRFPAYAQLAQMIDWFDKNPTAAIYCADQLLIDASVWYHLGWIAETARRSDARVRQLQQKATLFSRADRRLLLQIIHELLQTVIPRYRTLAQQGRVELAMSPYAHPIVPLLLDLNSAREAMPAAPLPLATHYPGGNARARWHLQRGIETFERHFGLRPKGCWPSEGSISTQTLELLAQCGFEWTASGETVLHNSVAASQREAQFQLPGDCLHRLYRANGMHCFFRDDGLSDNIGFLYADWHGDDAVANLVHNIEQIAANCPDSDNAVVSIILDGENAWEYYPENGFYFLDGLYKKLGDHPTLELTTCQRIVEKSAEKNVGQRALTAVELPRVVAGSWVYGTFSTWIGSSDKNRGWDLLCEAKNHFDGAVASGRLHGEPLQRAIEQLAICEGSDWFWWFGDYNPEQAVSDFEQLFRRHLRHLYALLDIDAPASLTQSISRGSGNPERGGVMLHGQETH
jgi:alpha-amylase/alpha-mannosidase (GH57 family)